ncbi:MAG: hypothetical protein ABIM31_03820 [candidate division WOR-3 bacterium]
MKRFILILFLPATILGFDLRGLLVNPKVTKGALEVKYRWQRTSRNFEESAELKVVYNTASDLNSLSVYEGERIIGTVFYDKNGNVVRQDISGRLWENLKTDQQGLFPDYKVVRTSKTNVGNKTCDLVVSERTHVQEDSKGNLLMKTTVRSQKRELYDAERGILIKQEIDTEVKQETYIKFDMQRPLNTRVNNILEKLELEE